MLPLVCALRTGTYHTRRCGWNGCALLPCADSEDSYGGVLANTFHELLAVQWPMPRFEQSASTDNKPLEPAYLNSRVNTSTRYILHDTKGKAEDTKILTQAGVPICYLRQGAFPYTLISYLQCIASRLSYNPVNANISISACMISLGFLKPLAGVLACIFYSRHIHWPT